MNNIRKGDFLDISPTNHPPINFSHNDKENTKSVAVLSLVQFSRPPYVSFGTVKLGTTRSEVLCIENPIDDATDVKVDKVASTKGFSVEQTQFIIPAEDSTCLTIHWTPAEEGNVRELVTFIANGISKHQAILLGRAEAPKRKKKSLWDSIKQKKAADVSAPFKEKKTNPSLKKAANKTFHVSRQPQYKTERVRSPLRSCNEELVLQERVEVLTGSIENHQERLVQENCTPVPFEKTHVTSAQTRLESVVSSKNSPVVLLVPAAKLFDAGDVTEVPCAVGTPCITDQKNVNRVLNMTHSPICTPEDGGNRLIPRIHSSQSPISSEGKVLSCVAQPFLPGTPVLSVKDALAIIQSDLTELDGASPPNACSSFDFSDSLESVKGNCGADQSPAAPELTEQRVQEVSTELEAVKPRLTFLVIPKTDQVKSFENEANDAVPLNFRKIPFSSSTVTKSRLHPNQESSRTIRKTRTSKRRLLEKTVELSVDSSAKSSLLGQQLVGGLPVIDLDASHDTHDSIRSPLVAMPPSDFSPVRCAHADHFTVSLPPSVAQLDLSPVMATPSCKSQTSVKSDLTVFLNVQHQSEVTSLMPQHDETLVDAQSSVAVPARSLSCSRKRKSDEFLADKTEKGKPFQVKRSRVFPAAKETKKTIQERKYSSRSTSQSLHRKTVVSQSSNLAASAVTKAAKSVSVAQTKLPLSKPAPQSLKSFSSSSVKTAKVVAVAQAQLTFIKPAQTVIPRHPLPFAAKNMFYDERWIEKQERGFVWWINYVLTPDDFKVSTEVTKVNAVSLAMGSDSSKCPKAPTKEEMSFRMYTARRRLNSLRRAACKLFTSEAMVKAIQRLELEVEAKRLLVRKDRHLWKDIGERQKILTWLLSYNPLWLRIGLETIFGELIPLESNSDVMGLAVFILNRLLWNPDIAAEFRHPKVPHLYRDGHEEALSRFTLKKLLLLVCFLDKAKESRMIEHDPCLFCMDAEFKTSKDLLLAFARDFLSGEGILSRHLGYLGLAVSHAQVPLDEFNFAVKNLASDLRCGIRLVRVMELFTQDWSLSRKLRMPAISRLQKVHNVELALDVLKAKGVDLKDEHGCAIDARDIVDGHREKTLTLLWKIIFTFQVEVLLDEEQLKEEICFLKRTWRTRQKLDALRANQDVAEKPKEKRPTFQHSNTKITLLMDWVNSVSAFYNSKAENFTVSFSDGQILCYLIHYYHPSHLPLEAVCRKTTQTVECGQQGRVGLNCSSSDSDSSFDTWPGQQNGAGTEASVDFTELLENEKSNFQLVDKAVSYLGGVPAMLHTADMSNTIPNEKVVMSYLSFLCARLLDLRNETRAARIIQGAWRKYRLKMELKHYKESNAAAATIQCAVKRFLQRRRKVRQNAAAIVIQTVWRSYSARQELRQLRMEKLLTLRNSAATVIQAQWRKHLAMKKFQRLKYYTVMMQARLRMKMAVTAYRRILWAARTIQKHRCACLLAKDERAKYLALRSSIIKIQKSYREWKTRIWAKKTNAATVIQRAFRKWQERRLAQKNVAAIKIQSWYRMVKCQKLYKNILQKTINIQAWYRGNKERRNFQFLKLQHSSAVAIQRAFKANILRRRFLEIRQAAIVIQHWFRACRQKESERKQYLEKKRAAITLQAAFRGYLVRKANKELQRASVVIQTAFRMFVARKGFLSLRKAALAVQQQYKAVILGRKLRKEYLDRRRSVVVLQALWRGRAERKKIEGMHKAAVLIQSYYRRYAARSEFKSKRSAALTIQSRYRAHRSGRTTHLRYLRLRKAAVSLQAGFRGMKARQKLRKQHRAATLIQATFKAFTCRRQFLSLKSAATVLQTRYRAHLLAQSHQRQYSLLRQMTVRIQAVYRGSKERRRIRRMHEAATTIQACFRRHKAQVTFAAARCAASVIQQRYRAYVKGRQERKNYLKIRDSVVVMQSAYRGMKVRHQVQEMHRSATVIQAHYRRHIMVVKFRRLRWAATVVGQRFRANQERNVQVSKYAAMKKAAVCIQSAYRGMTIRKRVKTMQEAARVIQRRYTAYREHKRFLAMRSAVIQIQQWYRALIIVRLQQKYYYSLRAAAITVQSVYRGMKVRREVQRRHKAATVIQAAFQMYRARMAFKAERLAATIIQRQYRAHLQRKRDQEHFLKLRHSAIVIQSVFRGNKTRREMRKMHEAATTIQACFRRHKAQVTFAAARCAASVIQQRYRAYVKGRQERKNYLKIRDSVVVMQSAYRGMKVRHQVQEMHRSATVIQAHYRRHIMVVKFQRLRWAATVVGQRFRANQERNVQVSKYAAMKKAAVCIQSAYRGMTIRKRVKTMQEAARVIQRRYTAYREHKRFLAIRSAVIQIQQWYRALILARLQQKYYYSLRAAAITVQSVYRGMKVRREVQRRHKAATVIQAAFQMYRARMAFKAERLAATIIQRQYRAHLQRKRDQEHFLKLRHSAIVIQSVFRGNKTRREMRKMHEAATTIQACFRRHKAQVTFAAARCAASVIQQRYRAYVKGRQERKNYLKIRDSVVVMQSAYRGMKVRHQVQEMHRSATVIQAHYRRHIMVVKFQRLRWAATVVGQRFRANQERNVQVSKYAAMKKAAVCIQSAYRGMTIRKRVKTMQEAARVIQRRYTAYREHKRFLAIRSAVIQIQQWYRALILARLQQKYYYSLRAAAITVQSVYRGMKVRREVQRRYKAATVIQTAFQMYRARMAFKAERLAATVIQRQYRAHLQRKRDQEHFLKLRHSAIVIQSVFRGNKTRREMRKMHSAATVIQSQFRMYQCRGRFKKMRWAAMAVQERYRACRVRDSLTQQYRSKRTAALVIQRAFRGHRVRRQVSAMHRAATVIQRRFCTFRDRKRFLSLRAGALLVQRRYRALVAMRTQRKEYLNQCWSTVILQAAYRGMKVRQHLQKEHRAAVMIQAHVRRHLVRSRYLRLQWATKVVQRHFRAQKMMKAEVQSLKEKMAATTLQAAFRGMKTRKHIKQMQGAASAIQRCFRTYQAHRKYLSLKTSVLAIQRRYRSVIATRQQKEHYHRIRSATITLQGAYRGYKTRKEMRQKHAAATVLQAEFRRHRGVVTFQAMRLAAVIIQRHYKSYKQRKEDREKFLMLRNSVIAIQAAFRGQRARRDMAQLHKAAVLIQSNYRMHRQRVAFQRMRWAAAVLQQKFRAQKLRDSQVLLYQQIKKATVCIQTSFRRKRARELLKRERAALKVQSFLRMRVQRRCFLQQRAASVVIQSAFRCYHARVRYAKMQTSSVQIQRWYKSCRLAQKQKAEHLAVRQATVTLQSAFRGVLARRLVARLRAAVKIQSVLQMFWHRKRFLNLRSSTVKIQSHYRMWTARRRFLSYRTAAVTLQKHFRAQQLMKDQRCAYVNTRKSIVTLQAAVRGHSEYKNFQRLKRSAVTIQAAFRRHQARRHAKRSQAALKIQAWFRGNVARQKFIAKQKAITTVRRCMQTRLHRNRFQKVRQSVCIIQRRWRETLDARRTHHDFLEMRSSAVKIQALWRGHIIRLNLQKEQKAACVIQSSYRGYVQRKAFQRMKRSVLVLQKHVRALRRGKEDLETFKITKSAVLTIQAFCRGWLVRRQLKEETQTRRRHRFSAAVYHHLCAVKIQRGLRAHWALKSAKRQLHYVIYIQRWIRAKLQKKRYLEKKMKIIKVQRAVRGWLSRRHTAAVVIQRAVKKYLSKKRELRVQRGIIKAQALWRGHRSRKANDTPKVVAIRHRFRKVNQRVKEEDRLCNKTTVAIDYLLRYKHFSYILAALKHLETATRLSPECCEHLVNSGATLVIFTLIRSCNRSVPCMEVITFAIQVLLNLSKYYKTTEAVYAVENSVNTLLDLLQIYREKAGDKVADKGGSIFTKTCFLLAILLQDEQRALEVRNLPKATDRIRSLYFLTARKHKMDTERTVTKLKMNVSLNGSLFTQPTPRKAKARPRIAPDWVLRRDKMKEVVDPLQAIQMVADAFTLVS